MEVHRLITHGTLDNEEDEGRFRTDNEVNVVDAIDGEIVHMPPDHSEVPAMMKELLDFFNDKDQEEFIHPIVKGCIIHFMIGFIHPFVDGNGRCARALFYWYLLRRGYWLTEYLSISRLIVKSKTQYALAFIYSEIDENDLTYFIHYKLKTMTKAYRSLRDYIQRKINEKRNFVQFHRIGGVNERQATIIKWIFDDPDILLTVKEIEMRLGVSNQTARNDLMGLVNQGYLDTLDLNKKTKAFCKGSSFDVNLKKRLRSG
ncbi:MAG: Fic family protein [Cyclobacteriaceae bacterium]|nr:Fic family protein [Cyclobacteriaceae bacterium]